MPEYAAVRPGTPADLARVAEIQAASPEASGWDARDYLEHDFQVAECQGCVAGFAVARSVCRGECELLNLAVDPAWRRRGLGILLLKEVARRHPGAIFLEVRESNRNAQNFYKTLGFEEVGTRPGYYHAPPEGAIVMRLRSC